MCKHREGVCKPELRIVERYRRRDPAPHKRSAKMTLAPLDQARIDVRAVLQTAGHGEMSQHAAATAAEVEDGLGEGEIDAVALQRRPNALRTRRPLSRNQAMSGDAATRMRSDVGGM